MWRARPPWDCEKDINSNGLLSAGLFSSQRDFTPTDLELSLRMQEPQDGGGGGGGGTTETGVVDGVTITTSSTGKQERKPVHLLWI